MAETSSPRFDSQPDPDVRARLAAAFTAEEAKLRAALAAARADFDHKGIRGDVVERAVREFLERHLPRKYSVGTGETIDRLGQRSSQLDVLVLNDEQPFVQERDTPGLYMIEGVSAVGEVKTRLDGAALTDMLEKGAKLRALRPTHAKDDIRFGNQSDSQRFVDSRPYFGLALESELNPDTVLERLKAAEEVVAWNGESLPALDALFVLDGSTYFNAGNGLGALRFLNAQGGPGMGWVAQPTGETLVNLFVWLNTMMPRILRSTSIATPYLMNVNFGQVRE